TSAGAAAPSAGGDVAVQFEACLTSTEKLHAIEQELNYLLSNIDEFLKRLSYRNVNTEEVCFTRVVPAFLKTSQPFFNYLESTARNRSPGQPLMAQEIRSKLLQFSQQLCSRTEHLVLTYASHGYLTLDESDPLCHSHFHIGECEVNNIELSIFRYCQPTPLVTLTRTGLYKRMRWNVKRNPTIQAEGEDENNRTEVVTQEVEGEQGARKVGGKQGITTEYYYLCHENVILVEGEPLEEKDRKPGEEPLLMWSVGKWEPIYTDSGTEDISE
ncbi:UPF0575 protein C19orf67, partial [Clarias magur]